MPVWLILLTVALAGAVLWFSSRLVGEVAERFGEDPARWRALMLPFNVFGPFVALYLLSHRNGGGRSA